MKRTAERGLVHKSLLEWDVGVELQNLEVWDEHKDALERPDYEDLLDDMSELERWQLEYEDGDGIMQRLSELEIREVALRFHEVESDILGVIQTDEPLEDPEVIKRREAIMRDYDGIVFSETTPRKPTSKGTPG